MGPGRGPQVRVRSDYPRWVVQVQAAPKHLSGPPLLGANATRAFIGCRPFPNRRGTVINLGLRWKKKIKRENYFVSLFNLINLATDFVCDDELSVVQWCN